MKIRIAKWQGPIEPTHAYEPARIVGKHPALGAGFVTVKPAMVGRDPYAAVAGLYSGIADAIKPEVADRRWTLEPMSDWL